MTRLFSQELARQQVNNFLWSFSFTHCPYDGVNQELARKREDVLDERRRHEVEQREAEREQRERDEVNRTLSFVVFARTFCPFDF
jgi:hypothetical protein